MKKLIVFFLLVTGLFAQDQTLSIQGVLRQPSGKAVADGTYSITFNFYNVATGGSPIAAKVQSVEVKDGLYTANIDISGIPFNEQYWIGIKIGTDNELTPRAKLTAAPYALALKGLSNEFPSTGTVVAGDSLRIGGSAKISGTLEGDGDLNINSAVDLSDTLKINNKETLRRESNGNLVINDTPEKPVMILKGSRIDLYVSEFNIGHIDGSGYKRVFVPDTAGNQLIMNYANDFDKVNIQSETMVKSLSFSQGGNDGFRIIHGKVLADNNNLTMDAAAASSVTLTYIGNDEIDVFFNTPFVTPPTVVVSAYRWERTSYQIHVEFVETGKFRIARFHNNVYGDGQSNDVGFTFIVVGY